MRPLRHTECAYYFNHPECAYYSGLLCDLPLEHLGDFEQGFFKIAVNGHPVPTVTIPLGKEFLQIAVRFDRQLGAARPIFEYVVDRLAAMKQQLLVWKSAKRPKIVCAKKMPVKGAEFMQARYEKTVRFRCRM